MGKDEKLTGAANRINRSLQHQLSLQKRFGQSKHKAKQAARTLKEQDNLKGYNPSKVGGIFNQCYEGLQANSEGIRKVGR